ncbi:MAG: N-methyl-L-tryptophan oxidase [Anaerolineales bacterium]
MRRDYKYIVLGLGGLGSAAAYWLSRRTGSEVLGLEQFELGHDKGGSHDHSRIIRLSYHTPGYVQLAKAAYEAWAALEADSNEKLILKTGGLDIFPVGGVIPMADYTGSLAAADVPFELLNATETMRRWPQWRLPDNVQVLYQAESGIAPANKGTAAHRRLARELGATLLDQKPITAIQVTGDEYKVVAGGDTFRCEKLIVTAGAWSNQLLAHFGLHLPLTVTQEQLTYFQTPHLDEFLPERFPIWIWMDEPCFYGFPVYGEMAVKGAQDVGGREVTTKTRTFEPEAANAERLTGFFQKHLPKAHGPALYSKTCLYTLTPDRDFVVDSLPSQPDAFFAIGAAHDFKFSSLIGKILSDLALDGRTTHDLSPFKFDRPILQMVNPPRNFMV